MFDIISGRVCQDLSWTHRRSVLTVGITKDIIEVMSTAHQPTTADQLITMPDDGYRYDLVRGELRKMTPAGFEHGAIIVRITEPLAAFVRVNGLGLVVGAETGFRIAEDPDTVLAPDVSFVRHARIPGDGLPKGFFAGPPDLAIEVVSPTDRAVQVENNVHEYLKTGTGAVCTVNPKHRTITVFRTTSEAVTLKSGDVLELPDLLPGFQLPLNLLFG